MKRWLTWLAVVLAIVLLFVTVYTVTLQYFRPGEGVEIFYIEKTLPVDREGNIVPFSEAAYFVNQDITEMIDMESFLRFLPLMKVSLYKEYMGSHWVGDVTYQIGGYINSGIHEGRHFHIMFGEGQDNYVYTNQRGHVIQNVKAWLDIMELLEGPNSPYLIPESEPNWAAPPLSIYYDGVLYETAEGVMRKIPVDAERVGEVRGITPVPDEELESSWGMQGNHVYKWAEDEWVYLGVQVELGQAFSLRVGEEN